MVVGKKDLGALPRWDLSNVYPGLESEALTQAVEALKAQLDEMDEYLEARQISKTALNGARDRGQLGEVVGGYLERMNANLRSYATVRAYLSSFVTTDSYNSVARRKISALEPLGVRLRQHGVRFQSWLGGLGEALPDILKDAQARSHAFYLQEVIEQSRYLMSEAEESLAAELGLSGGAAWNKLQGVVTSQLTVPFERDGAVEKLPMPALLNLSHDPDESVRRRAYEAELAAWDAVREPLAAALNGIKGAAVTLNKRRGRRDALHAALDDSRIDQETFDAMLGAMRDSFPAFRRYLKAKAKRLGKEALPWWDLFAPTGRSERVYTWAETQAFVVGQFRRFSNRLADLAQRAFDNRWIDAEPRDGKQGGAFCMSVSGVEESRVLCNFDGSLDQVFTVAHELGHAFHNECLAGKSSLRRLTPMTLAETASIFCETIVTDAVLSGARHGDAAATGPHGDAAATGPHGDAAATGPDEELAILETDLMGRTLAIVDIYSRYLFEREVFERRAQAELSADDFCEIMLRCQKEAYGDGLDERYLHKYMWTWKPHYYYPSLSFYNYPYAFGLLFGLGLYAIYQERGQAFVPDYEALLASTGEGAAADLAARFGINLRQKDFWAGSLRVIEKRIERYVAL